MTDSLYIVVQSVQFQNKGGGVTEMLLWGIFPYIGAVVETWLLMPMKQQQLITLIPAPKQSTMTASPFMPDR